MDIPSKQAFDVLSSKGVTELYHANSVATSCHFLREKSLVSRGTIERMGLKQTSQYSDQSDKKYSIWFDIFLDSIDIHSRANKPNLYGPVLFVFDINIINKNNTGQIWVTKLNPTKWAGKTETQRWFQNKSDLQKGYIKGQFDQMLVLRHIGGELPFGNYLKKIILDDPQYQDSKNVDYFSMATGGLRSAMTTAGINVAIKKRKCPNYCTCMTDYKKNVDFLNRIYDPLILK